MKDPAVIRARLDARKQELLARARDVHADITRASGPLDKDFAEQVVQMENDAVLAGLSATTAAEIAQINRALKRLEEGAYGDCAVCGQPIDERRLEALPHSDRCIRCAEFAR
ncbi:MAG: TraR/DksA family transcriptional regulator [Steroidobacteraceae bacterium]|jgi:RNA polymerase-binding transcription factor DksA|nr:TraR/DksA family transcriptional regulator [Steroidobacteraceae bacterium]